MLPLKRGDGGAVQVSPGLSPCLAAPKPSAAPSVSYTTGPVSARRRIPLRHRVRGTLVSIAGYGYGLHFDRGSALLTLHDGDELRLDNGQPATVGTTDLHPFIGHQVDALRLGDMT